MIDYSRARLIFLSLFALSVFLLTIDTIGRTFGDTGYIIKTGEYIYNTWGFPSEDPFSFAYPKNEWVPHYWLSGVIFFLQYKILGFWGLILGASLMAALTYFFVWKTAELKSGSFLLPSALIIPLSFITYEVWIARPQIFSFLFTAVLIFILEKWKKDKTWFIYLVPLLMALWANFHAGVILGILIIGVYGIENILNKPNIKFLSLLLISASFSLLNPYGYKTLIYTFTVMPAIKELQILEWQTLLNFLHSWMARFLLILMVITPFFVLGGIFKSKIKFNSLPWSEILLVLAGCLMPLLAARHTGFFPVLVLPILVSAVSKITPKLNARGTGVICLGLILIYIVLIGGALVKKINIPAVNENFLNAKSVDFAVQNNIDDKMFTAPIYGGYLIFKMFPETKVFIDGRGEVYSGTVNKEYLSIMFQSPGWETIVDEKYKFNSFYLQYRDANQKYTERLFRALTARGRFKLVYWDKSVIILARNEEENKEVIDKFAYHKINPYIRLNGSDNADAYQLELDRLKLQSPEAYFFAR